MDLYAYDRLKITKYYKILLVCIFLFITYYMNTSYYYESALITSRCLKTIRYYGLESTGASDFFGQCFFFDYVADRQTGYFSKKVPTTLSSLSFKYITFHYLFARKSRYIQIKK